MELGNAAQDPALLFTICVLLDKSLNIVVFTVRIHKNGMTIIVLTS